MYGSGEQTGKVLVASSTVTNANMTATLTDGSADVDFASATVPRNYKGNELHVYDSAGKEVVGFVYTNGAGTVQNIVSAKGGSTRNWTFKDAAFNNNDAGNYTYKIYRAWVAPVVASGSVTQANTRLDTTTANALAWLNGVDLTAYQTGKYILALYDSSNRARLGYISATAPAGETLDGTEVITVWVNGSPAYETLTVNANGHDIDQAVNSITLGWGRTQQLTDAVGKLFKTVATLTVASGQPPRSFVGNGAASSTGGFDLTLSTGANNLYSTSDSATNRYVWVVNDAAANWACTWTHRQVTDPPSTGAQIVITRGGSTRGWYFSDAHDPNTAQTYKIYYVGD